MEPLNEKGIASANQAGMSEELQQFLNALMSTPQYKDFDLARQQLRQDALALQAIRDFEQKQQYVQMMQKWNGVNESDRDELQRLYEQMMEIPTVQHYAHCQEKLAWMFREVALFIGEIIGTDFPPKRSSCCG